MIKPVRIAVVAMRPGNMKEWFKPKKFRELNTDYEKTRFEREVQANQLAGRAREGKVSKIVGPGNRDLVDGQAITKRGSFSPASMAGF